ncbi:MAG TPA: sigma-70 family RNA polymerase sigma factor [archaeon]|nr:sigma-70 family RNA polymerase sigma factor [archaeon]
MPKPDNRKSEDKPEIRNKDADEQLIIQAQAGSQSAFRLLYERYQKKIRRLVGSMFESAEDTDDIVQQAFIQAFRSLDSFKGKSSFYTWLYRIALNTTTDFRRKQARRNQSRSYKNLSELEQKELEFAASQEEGPERQLYRKELAGLMRKALNSLSAEHREVMVLREINALSYSEIAEITGVSIGTVMSRLHYARKKLAEILGHWQILETGG